MDQAAHRIGVCHGPRCADYGGKALAAALLAEHLDVQRLPCQSLCPHAPLARLDGIAVLRATPGKLLNKAERPGG